MPKAVRLARIASIAVLVTLTCLAAACGRSASPPTVGPPADPPLVPAGSASGGPPGTPGEPLCDVAECGPPIRMPSKRCYDDSIGGPTGRCLRKPDGRCAWEVRSCPRG